MSWKYAILLVTCLMLPSDRAAAADPPGSRSLLQNGSEAQPRVAKGRSTTASGQKAKLAEQATAPARNVLHLPAVKNSRLRGEKSPQSLPSEKSWFALTSGELKNSQRGPSISPSDSSDDDTIPSDRWERVIPVPVDPATDFNEAWLKENGGERLPPRRSIYDLPPAADFEFDPVPSDDLQDAQRQDAERELSDEFERYLEDELDSPLNDMTPDIVESSSDDDDAAPIAETHFNDQDFDQYRHYAEGSADQVLQQRIRPDWSDFGPLYPSMSQQLNYVQTNVHATLPADTGEHVAPESRIYSTTGDTFQPLLDYSGNSMHGAAHEGHVQPNYTRPTIRERLKRRLNIQEPWSMQATPAAAPVLTSPMNCNASTDFRVDDFAPVPVPVGPADAAAQLQPYYGKTCVPTQRPWVELWRPLYGDGIFSPAIPVFSDVNPLTPQFTLYGDYRSAVGIHRNNGQDVRAVANRLNLDMDLRLTGTERIHAFMGPLDHNGKFTRLDFSDSQNIQFEEELDAQFDTAFFEGDLGAIVGGFTGQDAPFDLPIAAGLMPMIYQNGVWMEDIVAGVAVALPWRHSTALNWSNYDVSFFALFDQITSPAFENNNGIGNAFGTAWFIEAYDGYIEADYAFMVDTFDSNRTYHNTGLSYTRRYFERISNSVRIINNTGQNGGGLDRTADGTLLLVENSLLTSQATTVIPYANLFYGFRNPQSAARAAAAGGILRNTGINFESDNLTNYPTLNATGSNSYGGAIGLNLFSSDFRRQYVAEFAALDTYGDPRLSSADGAQYGIGTRYQQAISNWSLIRLDGMVGWRDNTSDIFGTRAEWRWKF